jgi:hypothetical protein
MMRKTYAFALQGVRFRLEQPCHNIDNLGQRQSGGFPKFAVALSGGFPKVAVALAVVALVGG